MAKPQNKFVIPETRRANLFLAAKVVFRKCENVTNKGLEFLP